METGREVLLCVVPDTFALAFKPYAEWKHKTGTYVKVTKFSEIGANSSNPDIIKNYIGQCYRLWQYPPTYVLLVGDLEQVPIRTADGQSFANEDYFVEIDGNDVFPEMYIGRFTNNLTNPASYGLQTIINKVIKQSCSLLLPWSNALSELKSVPKFSPFQSLPIFSSFSRAQPPIG